MAIKLIIRDRRNPSQDFERVFNENRIVIGRSRTCHICLPDLTVSAIHMHIFLDGTEYRAMDLGSINGVNIKNKKLIPHRAKRLANNDVIVVAHYDIIFQLGVKAVGIPSRIIGQTQAKQMLGAIIKDDEHLPPSLLITGGPGGARRIQLVEPESTVTIGRGRQNEINIDDRDLSRRHAEVTLKDGKVTVKDLGGRNGVILNEKKVEQAELVQGDSFTVGKTTICLEHTIEPALLAIQKAPEEETSSFSPEIVAAMSGVETKDESTNETENLETPGVVISQGVTDPLLPSETADYVRTQEMPVVEYDNKSDTGLIVAGVILMLLSVFGLAWMLT